MGDVMSNECSQLNSECLQKKGNPCPAYESNKNCWEYDWFTSLKQLPKDEQEKWKSFMLEKCPNCAAYREPMKEMIQRNLKVTFI